MIKLTDITENLTNVFNQNPMGLTFKLFTDTGKYKRAIRRYNTAIDYINGIVSVTSSNVTKTNDGLIVGTMTNRIELLVRCKDDEEDIEYKVEKENSDGNVEVGTEMISGNETFLNNFRNYLDDFTKNNTYTTMTDSVGNKYDVSVSFNFAVAGVRQQSPGVGDSITYIMYAYYNFIQDGENSLRYKFILDGNQIPYTVATQRRAPTVEATVFSNTKDGSAKATVSSTVCGYSLSCPSFVSAFSNVIKNYLLNGERNVVHFLEVVMGEVSKVYLVVLGESSVTVQGVLNAGLEISFAEAVDDYDLISFPENFYIYYSTSSTLKTISFEKDTYIVSTGDYTPQKVLANENVDLTIGEGQYFICTNNLKEAVQGLTVIQNGNV